MKLQKTDDKGNLVVTKKDTIGRADARLVSLLSKINRNLKGSATSLYHNEDSYDKDKVVMTFNWSDKDTVVRMVSLAGFAAEVEACN